LSILITGIGGFVGRHLLTHLTQLEQQVEIHGTVIQGSAPLEHPALIAHALDLRDEQAAEDLLSQIHPTQIYHLAAQSSPRLSFTEPWQTLENNIRAQLNIIQGCLRLDPKPRLLIISSAEIYGPVRPEQLPIHEETPLRPTNPYGVSKVAQDMLGLQYHLSHQLPILRARPFNHIGPGQREGFVAVDFSMQIARIEVGLQEPVLQVGNLSAQRDFTDVRDVVRAYRLIVESGTPGEVYNVASGKSRSIQALLDVLLGYSRVKIDIRTDPARFLPVDVPVVAGDASRLRQAAGWETTIPFEATLLDVLNDCRERVGRSLSYSSLS
jgi:GDP-4-dehydro-6-deoxy-D-mannose reductase